ncbi:MAG TPA: DCC1-like thiol-disulfide oxidoreductase family protein [Vicinamibacteria bacterium]|nr:DCC1-like thiol-disulfide oxidoreductase family protein [Vicinamibacteria bacterium]
MSLTNGWTGGQYSLFRAILGAYLAVHFANLVPWGPELFSNHGMLAEAADSPLAIVFPNVLAWFDPPWFVTTLLLAAAGASLLLAAGVRDRGAAVGVWYVWACLLGRNPLILNPGIPYVGWILLAHALLPRAPYGSWEAGGRVDPGGGWRFPPSLFAAAWVVMAVGYTFSGVTKLPSPSWRDGTALARILDNPLARPGPMRDLFLDLPSWMLAASTWSVLALEILFAPLALLRRARPWLWSAMLALHVSLIALIDFADLSLGMVMLHLFTFDPAWVPRRSPGVVETLFYDGTCGLCHRAVRFLIAEDPDGAAFRFAPLRSDAFLAQVPEAERARLPDSLVLLTMDGRVLTRSAAARHLMERLGGIWRALAAVLRVVPAGLQDATYDTIARIRHRLFDRPQEACPLLPPHLRARFLD